MIDGCDLDHRLRRGYAANHCILPSRPLGRPLPSVEQVDPTVREVMGINLKDAVVIFDEVSTRKRLLTIS